MKNWFVWLAGAAGVAGVVGLFLGLKGAGVLEAEADGAVDLGNGAARSPDAIFHAVQKIDPQHNPTLQNGYLGQPNWCNRFVHLVCDELGVPLIWGEYGTKANDQIEWLGNGNGGWFKVSSQSEAQSLAINGYVVLATYWAMIGSGHMALVLPIGGAMQIAQAGKHCYNQASLQAGFGAIHPEFFAHV